MMYEIKSGLTKDDYTAWGSLMILESSWHRHGKQDELVMWEHPAGQCVKIRSESQLTNG